MVDHGGRDTPYELTAQEWEFAPLLLGRPGGEDRQVSNGVVHKIRIEVPWRDLPERYGLMANGLHPLLPLRARQRVHPRTAVKHIQLARTPQLN